MSANGSTHKTSDGALQQQNYKSSSLPGSPRMPSSPANSIPPTTSAGGGGIKVKIKRTSSTDSRHTPNSTNGNKANSFLESSSVSPDSLSNSSGMEYSIDTEMSCLSNSSSSNSKGDKVLSQPLKCETEAVSGNASKTSNVLKRHLDGFPTNSTTTQENQPPLQQNQSLNQNSSRREPPSKKSKINGGGVEDLPNGDCQKSTTKSLAQQNKPLSSSTATSTSNKGVTSSDSDLHSTNTNDKVSLQNGTNLSSDAKRFSDNSFVPSVLNYALTSTSSPSSQTSSIPESELVLDSSSGLLVKKSDEIRSSDSPTIEINGTNCNEVSTMTDPDSLGPCEPGTAVKLQGIVWQETDKGLLVLNVTWKNKTFMGTLLDCHRTSDSHKWAGPKDPTSNKKGGKRGRGSRSRTPPVKLPQMKKNKAKLNLPGTTKTNNGTIPESPLSKDGLNNRRRMPPVNYGESEDEDIMPKDDESGDEAAPNPQNESMSPSSRLIECPKPQCFKKFRDLDALKYHLSYTHNDLKEDKPINKKLKKKKKLLAKRKREANAKGCTEKIEIKKETETNFLESSSKLYMNDSKLKTEVKLEENDMSRHSSMKIYQALNGSDGRSLESVKLEQFSKSSANHSSSYPVYGSSSNPQPLALTSSSSSGISQKSDNFNSQSLSAGSSISKGLNSQHNINYLMSNHQQERLNLEGSKGHVSNQPPPAHGGSSHLHPAQSNLLQNGSRTSMSMAKELDGRLSSLAQNGSNEHRSTGYQPLNLGSSKDHWASKSQNPNHGPLQKQRSSGGPASPAYSDISDEESTTNSMTAITGNGNNSSNKTGSSRGLPLGPYQSTSQSRSADQDQARKSTMSLDAPRSASNQLNSASDRKTDGTKPTTQTIGPPPSHLPPELHGGSLAFPPHLSAGIPGLPPGFPPHLVASLAASMGAASAGAGHRFPSPMPPIPGLPGSSNPNVKALDILQQHANQYIATSKLQELQDRAGQGKSTGAVNSSSTSSPLPVPKSTSPSMSHLLGLNRGNVASSSPPLLRHEHNHTHVHLGYPPPGLPPSGLSGPASGSSSSLLGAASNAALGSSLRGVAPPAGSIAVPGAPPTSHLPPPSPSSIMSGLFGSGSPGPAHGMRLSSSSFPPK